MRVPTASWEPAPLFQDLVNSNGRHLYEMIESAAQPSSAVCSCSRLGELSEIRIGCDGPEP